MRQSTALLSIAALSAAALALWQTLELRAERSLNAELTARIEKIVATPVAAPASAPMPAVIPQVPVSAPGPPTAAIPAVDTGAVENSRRAAFAGEEWMARQRQLLKDPRYREAWYEQQRLQMSGRRERLKDALALSDAQADALIDLSIDRQLSWQFQTQTYPMTDETMREQRERAEAARITEQTKLREVLGETKYAQYEEYLATSPSRQQVDRLRGEVGLPVREPSL